MLLKKPYLNFPYIIISFAFLLNIIARMSMRFCDFYVVHIYPLIVGIFARIASVFLFSIGEVMIYIAAFLVLILFIGGFICIFRSMIIKEAKNRVGVLKVYTHYSIVCLWLAAIFFLIMTLNCFILYHCSPIDKFYPIGTRETDNYGMSHEIRLERISRIRDFIIEDANKLAAELKRDQKGYLIYEGDMISQAQSEMRRLGNEYDRLSGYYPRPKSFFFSNFFSQQNMMGYFFPFSMEANYNTMMYIVNIPTTICHELSHVKGFIYEDEANFLGFLACVDSEDDFFRYSAYLSVLNYVERDFIAMIKNDAVRYREHPQISELVKRDNIFLTADAWELVEKTAIFNTDFVRNISNEILETNLTLNGVSDGTESYGRVVGLLLKYYEGILY